MGRRYRLVAGDQIEDPIAAFPEARGSAIF